MHHSAEGNAELRETCGECLARSRTSLKRYVAHALTSLRLNKDRSHTNATEAGRIF